MGSVVFDDFVEGGGFGFGLGFGEVHGGLCFFALRHSMNGGISETTMITTING